MFKVSHELPINMLDKSFEINDYEYCLPHLLDQNETYRKHFEDAKESGSYIIMDNSLHELGVAYDTDRLMYWINHLEPNEFIVPDVWQDKTATLVNAKRWMSVKLPESTTKVAVVQAQSYHEAFECYNILKMQGYKKIAFSYGASWFQECFQHPNPDVAKMMGRLKTITNLYKNNIISDFDRVHLLGCNLPQAYLYYKDFPFVETIDTSNPVIHGLKGIRYSEGGLLHKDKEKIDEDFTREITPKQIEDILHNTKMFRKINNL